MVLALFLDGVGIGAADPAVNPLIRAAYPAISELLAHAVPLDACLDLPGLPQSSTGQVALFTGCNAARLVGGHRSGFPGPELRRLLAKGTFYHTVVRSGGRAVFLNAFGREYLYRLTRGSARVSASTLAAVTAGLPLLDAVSMRAGKAVYQDITGEGLRLQGDDVELVTPEDAAAVALAVAKRHDLTLFEFFLTDIAGHRGDEDYTHEVLSRLDRFADRLMHWFASSRGRPCYDWLVVFSDHGNLEDMTTQGHTPNPVPLVVWPGGNTSAATIAAGCRSITDVAGLLTSLVQLAREGG